MNRTERLYKIQSLLCSKSVVPVGVFLKSLEISRATFRRDLDYLRDRLGAPILWDRDAGGYRLEAAANQEPTASLPGLWLSDSEILALLTMIQLLSALEPNSLINNQITPIKKRIQNMLETGCVDADALTTRVRILPTARRPIDQDVFNRVADALLTRQRIEIAHLNKGTNQETVRQISPQQLVYYRDNWYVDAFCHDKDDLRSFPLTGSETSNWWEAPLSRCLMPRCAARSRRPMASLRVNGRRWPGCGSRRFAPDGSPKNSGTLTRPRTLMPMAIMFLRFPMAMSESSFWIFCGRALIARCSPPSLCGPRSSAA